MRQLRNRPTDATKEAAASCAPGAVSSPLARVLPTYCRRLSFPQLRFCCRFLLDLKALKRNAPYDRYPGLRNFAGE